MGLVVEFLRLGYASVISAKYPLSGQVFVSLQRRGFKLEIPLAR